MQAQTYKDEYDAYDNLNNQRQMESAQKIKAIKNQKLKIQDTTESLEESQEKPDQKVGDWIVPVHEDKSITQELKNFDLRFSSIDVNQENLLQLVYYEFKGSFHISISIDQNARQVDKKVTIQFEFANNCTNL